MSRTAKSFVIVAVFAAAATGSARMAADAAPRQPVDAPKAPAATQNPATEHAATPNPAKPPAIDPHATHALEQMGRFLRNQKRFSVRTTTHTDYVLANGQKVKLDSRGDLQAERPNKIRANIVSDRKDRQLFFDGHTFVIYSPKLGYYATATEQGTIEQLADKLQAQYGLELPLVDLFRIGADPDVLKDVTEATYIGPATIDGVATDQFAFRQPGVDWQIWIQQGDKPLPRKLVFTTTDDPARPEHAVDMAWDLAARPSASVFSFVPPKGSQKIAMADVTTQQKQTEQARRSKRSAKR